MRLVDGTKPRIQILERITQMAQCRFASDEREEDVDGAQVVLRFAGLSM